MGLKRIRKEAPNDIWFKEGLKPVIYSFTLWQKPIESTMAMTLRIVIPPHPLIGHWLTMLRTTSTPPPIYATGLEELGTWLTYEALRDWLPHRKEKILTTQGNAEGILIESSVPLIAIPLLPGGINLWNGGRKVLPNADLCLSGIPNVIEKNAGIIIFIDQIATGGRLKKILSLLKNQNIEPQRLRVITALASSPGLTEIGKTFPELTIYSSCIDPELTENEEISPGIGNPILRLNTRTTSPI